MLAITAVFAMLALTSQAVDTESITMTSADGFRDLRECVKYCFEPNGYGYVGGAISCAQNNCLCRTDLASDAHSAVSSCVITQQCSETNTVDISMAISFFDAYCSTYEAIAAGSVIATTTEDSTMSSTRTTSQVSAPRTATVTETTEYTTSISPTSRATVPTLPQGIQSTSLSGAQPKHRAEPLVQPVGLVVGMLALFGM